MIISYPKSLKTIFHLTLDIGAYLNRMLYNFSISSVQWGLEKININENANFTIVIGFNTYKYVICIHVYRNKCILLFR